MASTSMGANGTATIIDGAYYYYQNSGASDAAVTEPDGSLQFTAGAGDFWSLDPHDVNRSEIAGSTQYANGTTINVGYTVNVESGGINPDPTAWVVIGQFHQNDGPNVPHNSPPFSVELVQGKMVIDVGYTDATGKDTTRQIWADPSTIVQGQPYAMSIQATFDPDGNGHLVVSRNGVELVSYTGPLGYDSQSSVYWKEGIYRSVSNTTTVADYSDLTVSTQPATAMAFAATASDVFSTTIDYDPTSGAMSGRTVLYRDGSTVQDFFANGETTQHIETNAAGLQTLIQRYNADGSLAYEQHNNTDGSQTTATYSTTGVLQLLKVTNADGSRSYTDYTAAGYQSIVTDINAQGVTTEVDQTYANGSKRVVLYGTMAAQGYTSQVTLYSAAGVRTSQTVAYADGSHDAYQYGITNAAYTSTLTRYNAQGATTELQQIFADGSKHVADYNGQGFTSKVTFLNAAGAVTSVNIAFTNGSTEADSYTAGVLTQKVVTGTNGSVTTDSYSSAGALQQVKLVNADGSRVYTDYTAAGYQSIVTDINAQGVTTEVDQTYANGSKRVVLYGTMAAQGYTSEVTSYSAAGVKTAQTIAYADGSHDAYQYGITNAAYTSTLTRYNAQGATTELQQFFADGSKHVTDYNGQGFTSKVTFLNAAGAATSVTTAFTNGTTEADSYTAGVLTQKVVAGTNGSVTTDSYSSAGALQQVKLVNADGSRVYTDYTAAGYQSIVTDINAQGVTTEVDQTYANGSKRVATYGVTGQTYTNQVSQYDPMGTLTNQTRYHADGTLDYTNTLGTNGTRTISTYDATGKMTSSSAIASDGTITEKALAAGISMSSSPGNDHFTSYHSDSFVFSGNFGQDTISGFNAGSGSLHDTIQFDKSQVADFSHLAVAQSGADTVLTVAPHETVTLQGVQASTLTASNFKFA